VPAQHIVGELLQDLGLFLRGVDLEVAEAQEGRRHAAHHRAGLGLRIAVVEHVADHLLAGPDQRQGARGGDAKKVHRLAAQELAQG